MEWPDNWDRYDVIGFLGDWIRDQEKCFRVRVTSVEISDFFGKVDFFANYEYYQTTSRWENPKPGTYFGGMDDWKKHLREKNINSITDE